MEQKKQWRKLSGEWLNGSIVDDLCVIKDAKLCWRNSARAEQGFLRPGSATVVTCCILVVLAGTVCRRFESFCRPKKSA